MLQILLMILKLLGILLLVILGIILTILFLVLFVPVRYRVDASFDGKPSGNVLVSWLLHLITIRVNYDGKVNALVKILWFRLFDKTVWPAEETEVAEVVEPVEQSDTSETKVSDTKVSESQTTESITTEAKHVNSVRSEKIVEPIKTEPTKTSDDPVRKSKLESLIENSVTWIQNTVAKINCTYQQICGKVNAGQEKIEQVRTFLTDHENRNTIGLLWRQVKKLFHHILPKKIRGRVRFGFDDPATTGQILTYVSPFYGLYAKTVELEPVFGEKVLDGELHVKGHIRVASLLWIVIRVFLNKNFRVLLKKVMALGKK